MEPQIFFTNFDRDPQLDRYYGALGRALLIATRFEAYAKNLTGIITIRQNPMILIEPEKHAHLLEEFDEWTLAKHIREFKPLFLQFESFDLDAIFRDARESRNEIAHEAALGVEDLLKEPFRGAAFLGRLKELVRAIALADRIVCVALSQLTHEELPSVEFLSKYEDAVAEWAVGT